MSGQALDQLVIAIDYTVHFSASAISRRKLLANSLILFIKLNWEWMLSTWSTNYFEIKGITLERRDLFVLQSKRLKYYGANWRVLAVE